MRTEGSTQSIMKEKATVGVKTSNQFDRLEMTQSEEWEEESCSKRGCSTYAEEGCGNACTATAWSNDEEWPVADPSAIGGCKKSRMAKWRQPAESQRARKKMNNPAWEPLGGKDTLACLFGASETGDVEYIMSVTQDGFVWKKEEAAVDSGAIDCVTSRKRFPHLEVKETPESIRGECWTCAGGKQIKKEGEMALDWVTSSGQGHKIRMKVGDVRRTLISADKLLDRGNQVMLSKRDPRIITKQGRRIPLKRSNGMFLLEMWYKVPVATPFTGQGRE